MIDNWLKVMRMLIGLTISHFLLLTVSITECPQNKNMGKTGNWHSIFEKKIISQGIPKKSAKCDIFGPLSITL